MLSFFSLSNIHFGLTGKGSQLQCVHKTEIKPTPRRECLTGPESLKCATASAKNGLSVRIAWWALNTVCSSPLPMTNSTIGDFK
jgi:hypothetical protein